MDNGLWTWTVLTTNCKYNICYRALTLIQLSVLSRVRIMATLSAGHLLAVLVIVSASLDIERKPTYNVEAKKLSVVSHVKPQYQLAKMSSMRDIKPGHQTVKEYHFHVYWAQNNREQEAAALAIRDSVILEVAAGNMTVVCDGVTSDILPGLDDSEVPHFNTQPKGPHPVGSFEVWTPREYLEHMMTFMMYHRGSLSVLVHPLGKTELRDHTSDAMWLGPSYPLDLSALNPHGGDDPQYPELGLGYSREQ